jgi:glycosyltransferase involved in cell wall biosynthesis
VLVPPRDPQALAKALVRVLRDGALRTRLRTAGIAAAEDLSWETVATRVIAVYDEALAAAPAARPRRTRTRA